MSKHEISIALSVCAYLAIATIGCNGSGKSPGNTGGALGAGGTSNAGGEVADGGTPDAPLATAGGNSGRGGSAGDAATTSVDCSGVVCAATSPATPRCAGTLCVIDLAESPNMSRFALDSSNIYWTDFGNVAANWTDGAVMTAPRAGGKTTTLASNQLMAHAIVVDDKNVYWLGGGTDTGNGFVRSVPKAGGTTTTLASGLTDLAYIAVDDSNLYWTGGDAGDGRLMSMPKTGGTPTALASGGTFIGIAVDATNVYFSSFSSFYVSKVPKAGGTSSTIGPYGNYPAGISLNDSYVFWANDNTDGSIAKVAKSGGQGGILASAQASPTSTAADASNVYWTLSDAGTILKIPVEGGTITTVVSGQSKPACVTVDGDNLYWIGSGKSGRAILTTAK